MSVVVWGTPLSASNANAIDEAHGRIKYPGIYVSNGKQLIINDQTTTINGKEAIEENHMSFTGGVVWWSIMNTTDNTHHVYALSDLQFNSNFLSVRDGTPYVETITVYESVTMENSDGESEEYWFGKILWSYPEPHPHVESYYVEECPTDDEVIRILSQFLHRGDPISYAQKPFNLNIIGGDVWNFIAVEPGAWFYSVFDDHQTHHVYFLAGNEFKLLEFQDADGNGVIPHKEYHSAPIVIKGKRYHSLYLSRTVDSVCPFPTEYHKRSEMPSDEYFYEKLSEYVCEYIPFDRGDVLGLLALRNLLSANSGDVNVDLDDLKAMLKGYMVEERQNPYLDDPNLDDTGHPTVSFHD